jgi:hypothetical protein
MDETSGVLRPVVIAYLEGREMSPDEIAVLRAYLRQWIDAPAWDANPYAGDEDRARLAELRTDIDELTSRQGVDRWIAKAVAEGLDPL